MHLLPVALLRQKRELHALPLATVLRRFVHRDLIVRLGFANERDAHVERDWLPLRLARLGRADHHLGELASKVVLFFLRHRIRVAATPLVRVFIVLESVAGSTVRADRVGLRKIGRAHV